MTSTAPAPAAPAPPEWLAGGRIPGLDGLRAVAVLLVVFAHTCQTHGFPGRETVPRWGKLGAVGVDVFFVLSGFLITTLLCRERDRAGWVSLRGFYRRRILRIVPAYVAFLLFVAALQLAGRADLSGPDWLAALTYTMNFRPHPAWEVGHLWSLSIEEHFYLVWPLAFIALSPRWAVRALAVTLVAGPALRWAVLLFKPEWSAMAGEWTPTRLDAIAVGCLVALVARRPGGVARLDALARWWPAALLALLLGLVGGVVSGKFGLGVTPSVVAFSVGVLVWAAARRGPRWLELRPVVAVGVGSYSLYLWQQPFLNPRSELWWAAFPQNLAFAGLAAALSYFLVERPFIRIKAARPGRAGEDAGRPAGGPTAAVREAAAEREPVG